MDFIGARARRVGAALVAAAALAVGGSTAHAQAADYFGCTSSIMAFYANGSPTPTSTVGTANPVAGAPCANDTVDLAPTLQLIAPGGCFLAIGCFQPQILGSLRAGPGDASTMWDPHAQNPDVYTPPYPIASSSARFGIYQLVLGGVTIVDITNAESYVTWDGCDGNGVFTSPAGTTRTVFGSSVQSISLNGRTYYPGTAKQTIPLGNNMYAYTNVTSRSSGGIVAFAVVITKANVDGAQTTLATLAESRAGGHCAG